MSAAEHFFDTNVLLYLLSSDTVKADRAEDIVAAGGTISVQVLNEFSAVALRTLRINAAEVREALEPITAICTVVPLTFKIHQRALAVAARYRFSFYDALIAAAALDAGCTTLYTEDLQDGQLIEGALTVKNPFRSSPGHGAQ